MLRKRQSFTVTWEPPSTGALEADPFPSGRVKILESPTGKVLELTPGETAVLDATLYLSPLEGGWELLP